MKKWKIKFTEATQERILKPIPVGDARLLDGLPILHPEQLELVERASVGDALEPGDGGQAGHHRVHRGNDDLGGDVRHLAGVHLQPDVPGVLFATELGVRCSGAVFLLVPLVHVEDDQLVVRCCCVLGPVQQGVVVRLPGDARHGLAGDVGEGEEGRVAHLHPHPGHGEGVEGGHVGDGERNHLGDDRADRVAGDALVRALVISNHALDL